MPASKKIQREAKKSINRRKANERNIRIAQILGAAKTVFIAKGYDTASVREIALGQDLPPEPSMCTSRARMSFMAG